MRPAGVPLYCTILRPGLFQAFNSLIIVCIELQLLLFQTTLISYISLSTLFPHGLIRINIILKLITNNYNYLSHTLFRLLNILIQYSKTYIFIIIWLQTYNRFI